MERAVKMEEDRPGQYIVVGVEAEKKETNFLVCAGFLRHWANAEC